MLSPATRHSIGMDDVKTDSEFESKHDTDVTVETVALDFDGRTPTILEDNDSYSFYSGEFSEGSRNLSDETSSSSINRANSTSSTIYDEVALPYDANDCLSKLYYYYDSFLVTNKRLLSLALLYSSIWPRLLAIVDMYTVCIYLHLFVVFLFCFFFLSVFKLICFSFSFVC